MATLKLSPVIGMTSTVIFGVAAWGFSLLGGWLSDRYSRKPVMLWPRMALLLLTYSAFMLLIQHTSLFALACATTPLAALTALSGSLVIESCSSNNRPTAVGLLRRRAMPPASVGERPTNGFDASRMRVPMACSTDRRGRVRAQQQPSRASAGFSINCAESADRSGASRRIKPVAWRLSAAA